jgi:hypothetical protein
MKTNYYPVIGNRDYIKIGGQKRPYWEFLDRQPPGWLTSLAYHRTDLPESGRLVFDCGAWTYKEDQDPKIGKNLVTPEWALEQYQSNAKPGDFVVAPDHMLIEKYGSLEYRREFNRQSAIQFLRLTRQTEYIPMAVVHGVTPEERLENSRWLTQQGYEAIALGGLAGRPSAKREHITLAKNIRQTLPTVWIHVLGLSSPFYARQWHRIGINSFDGSSHFKQAFTAGVFFTEEQGKLTKLKAARTERGNPDAILEPITAPLCDCRACSLLRQDGVDTRTYGSNENNMGRAAHNQNMLMRAHRWAMRPVIVLVSCVGKKMSEPAPASELYQSAWFRKARSFATQQGDDWYILSALHGLLGKDEIVEPYDATLNDMDSSGRILWGRKVSEEIQNLIPQDSRIVVLAGTRYREHLMLPGYTVEIPMEGLGIGQQLKWLDTHTNNGSIQLKLF